MDEITHLKQPAAAPNNEKKPSEPAWKTAMRRYQRSDLKRSVWQLINSVVPYLALWVVAYMLLDVSYWATIGVCVLASGFLTRVFIIAHDCGHGSFFKSRKANAFWGSITSALASLPYHAWRHEHAIHHAHSGDLDNRGVGDIDTMTVNEYLAASKWVRLKYRLYRHPFVMFVIGPLYIFTLNYRKWSPGATRRVKMSVIRNNLALVVILAIAHFTIGIKAFFMVQLPIIAISGSLGIWLFYVQHQFEDVYWEHNDKWDFVQQALHGSSYFKLPKILQWFSGNIGFHHIHHLGAKVPNYFLEKVHNEVALFREVKPVTMLASLKCLSFRLYDEESRSLVGFSHISRLAKQ